MKDDQKKLLMIQNIIEANQAYHQKYLSPICANLMEAALIDEKALLSIKKVLQGNFDI